MYDIIGEKKHITKIKKIISDEKGVNQSVLRLRKLHMHNFQSVRNSFIGQQNYKTIFKKSSSMGLRLLQHRLPSELIDDDVCGNCARTLLPLEISKSLVWVKAKSPKKILKCSLLDFTTVLKS